MIFCGVCKLEAIEMSISYFLFLIMNNPARTAISPNLKLIFKYFD